MFNKNFYPTPDHVIEKMLEPYHEKGRGYSSLLKKTILEPSAGKGNIIDFIQNHFYRASGNRRYKANIYALEINPDLQAILNHKECKVIGSDFLTTMLHYNFDLILMNPPFDNGAAHLLQAWKTIRNGDIVCLLNAETITNAYTKERKLLKRIIDKHGTVEYLDNSFNQAERPTNVKIALVRLKKQTAQKQYFETIDFDKEAFGFPKDMANNQPAVFDTLRSYEHRYRATIQIFTQLFEIWSQFVEVSSVFMGASYSVRYDETMKAIQKQDFNAFIESFNTNAWNKILDQSQFTSYLTDAVRKDFNKKFKEQSNLAFTKENMLALFDILFLNKDQILLNCIEEVFDNMTAFHKKNIVHIEGWKTNDAWRVNKKIIMPHFVRYGEYTSAFNLKEYGDLFRLNYHNEHKLVDIDRAMCHIKGLKIEQITTIHEALNSLFEQNGKVRTGDSILNDTESTFFKIRFFKKGTLHITFKEDFLWREFNYFAAKAKGFPLPDRYSEAGEMVGVDGF